MHSNIIMIITTQGQRLVFAGVLISRFQKNDM